MLKSDLWIFGLISLAGAVFFGGLSWAFFSAFRRTQSAGKRAIIGMLLGIFGLIALGCTACGLMIIGS